MVFNGPMDLLPFLFHSAGSGDQNQRGRGAADWIGSNDTLLIAAATSPLLAGNSNKKEGRRRGKIRWHVEFNLLSNIPSKRRQQSFLQISGPSPPTWQVEAPPAKKARGQPEAAQRSGLMDDFPPLFHGKWEKPWICPWRFVVFPGWKTILVFHSFSKLVQVFHDAVWKWTPLKFHIASSAISVNSIEVKLACPSKPISRWSDSSLAFGILRLMVCWGLYGPISYEIILGIW